MQEHLDGIPAPHKGGAVEEVAIVTPDVYSCTCTLLEPIGAFSRLGRFEKARKRIAPWVLHMESKVKMLEVEWSSSRV